MGALPLVEKPHAVCIPYPAQGHINPMLKLAKLLHFKGFHITFVNTEYNHKRLLKSRGPNSLDGIPSFQFKTIPDGPPPTATDVTQDIPSLCDSTTRTCLAPFKELLSELNDTKSSNVPPVSCIVSDGVMSFTLDAAEGLGIPGVLFWTTSARGLLAYDDYLDSIEKGSIPLKDWIPGLEGMRLKDFPSFIRTTNTDEFLVQFARQETKRAQRASAIVLNTFEALEHDDIAELNSKLPLTYSIGPLQSLLNQATDTDLKSNGSNPSKEDSRCLEWLDSKEPNSVVYVNFGSITVMTSDQLIEFAWGLANSITVMTSDQVIEFAWGLANSNKTFLWVIRPDLVNGDDAVLPQEFITVTKERGLLASWCPQEQVLSHPSIGGFLTHSGWNSTLESITEGVPMICWSFFAEQQTNCRSSCTEWGVDMEINSDVKRDEVESLVRELMEGNKGKDMKQKALQGKNMAKEAATSLTGSSYLNLDNMINQVLLSPRN